MAQTAAAESNLAPVYRLLTEGTDWRKCIITPSRQAAAFVPWEKLTAQPVRLSRGLAIKVVTRSGRKEHTATLDGERWTERLTEALDAGPCHLDVLCAGEDWHARRTREGRWLVSKAKPSTPGLSPGGPAPHDRAPNHQLNPDDPRVRALFTELGLFSPNGQLLGDMAPKFRQVQHFLELLRPLPIWAEGRTVRVVDAGCGKAYLSLALALWAESGGATVSLDAVDASLDVVETVARSAMNAGVADVRTHAVSIAEFVEGRAEKTDLLVSLHACDTATDEALAAGVRLDARAIVLVPCCHQELVTQISDNSAAGTLAGSDTWGAVLRSGLLKHRLADIVTDALRASALESLGYRVDVIEFVSPEATARNLMIRAEKRGRPDIRATRRGRERYQALASEWGVHPALERLLGDLWSTNAS